MERWDERNKNRGWDEGDVQAEFSDYFARSDISEFTADDWDALEIEFENVMAMLNKGEKSGKGEKQYYYEGNEDSDGGWWNAGSSNQSDTDGLLSKKEKKDKRKGRGRRNEKAYETALYTAGES